MTPLVPFGNRLKQGILSSFEILDPVLSALPALGRSINLDLSLAESGYSILVDGSRALITFSYALDDDQDAANGRLILQDSFELQIPDRKFLTFKRTVQSLNAENFWLDAAARLNRLKAFDPQKNPVKKFFNEVVKDLEIVAPKEVVREKPVSINEIFQNRQPLFHSLALPVRSESFAKLPTLLERRKSQNTLSPTQRMLDGQLLNYVSTVSNPEMIACLLGGSFGFQLGRSFGASFNFKSVGAARLVSTGMGLVFEAPAFEASSRIIRNLKGEDSFRESFASSLPRHYLTFGAFRGASLVSRSSLAAFGALHGVNEFERRQGLRPGIESDYIHRIVEDGILFSQLTFAAHLSEVSLAKSLGTQHVIQEKIFETELSAYSFKRVVEDVPLVPPVPPLAVKNSTPAIPLSFFPELRVGEPVLATQLPDPNGVHLRELIDHRSIPKFGEVSAFTEIGLDKAKLMGKRSQGVNEDSMGFTLDAVGNPVLIVCDGVGGTQAGEIASKVTVERIVEEVSRSESKNLGEIALEIDAHVKSQTVGQTVMAALRIFEDGSVEHVSVGDIRFWIIRSHEGGSRRVYEPRVPHTLSSALRTQSEMTTVAFNAHPWSNQVLSGLGGVKKRDLKIVRELDVNNENQIFHQQRLQINEGSYQAPNWKEFKLKEGDGLLLMSDGVASLLDEAQLLGLVSPGVSAAENLSSLHRYTLEALKLFEWRFVQNISSTEKVEIPSGFIFEGKFISRDGNIYEPHADQAGEWILVAHVSPDNVTAIWYQHNPKNELPIFAGDAPPLPLSVELPSRVPPPPSAILPVKIKLPIIPPVLKLTYAGQTQALSSPDSLEILVGRDHPSTLFPESRNWIEANHFKIEAVQENGIWLYRLTSLVDSGLWIENHLPGKQRFFRILQKGESQVLHAQTYELKFKQSERDWDEGLFIDLPRIQEAP